jgi:hypothetical protein
MGTIADRTSNDPAPYKFELISTMGSPVQAEPMEWNEGITKLSRDKDLFGVFTSYSIDSLTFVDVNAVQLLYGTAVNKGLFRLYEIDAVCLLRISIFNQKTRFYEAMPTDYSLKFGAFKIKKIGDLAIGVNVGCTDSSLLSKYKERKGVAIDLVNYKSGNMRDMLGGGTFSDYTGFPLNSKLKIPALSSFYNGKLAFRNPYANDSVFYAYGTDYNSIPATVISNDTDLGGCTTVVLSINNPTPNTLGSIITVATAKTLTVDYSISTYIENAKHLATESLHLYIGRFNAANELLDEQLIRDFSKHNGVETYASFDDEISISGETFIRTDLDPLTFNMEIGDKLKAYLKNDNDGVSAFFVNSVIKISEEVADTLETIIDGLPIYEALETIFKMICDVPFPFYSEKFGRAELEYAPGKYYGDLPGWVEDSRNYGHLCSGVNIRGLTIYDENGRINVVPEKFLNSVSAIYCTGMSIETIEGTPRFRIEDRDFFYNDTEIIDLSDRINILDIEMEYLPQMAYNQIEYGYENFEFLSTNGRSEPNTKCTRSTQLTANETLNIVCDFVTATTAIVLCLNKPISLTGSEDTKFDNNVFFFKSQIDSGGGTINKWIAETNELVTIENNSSPYKDSTLNRWVTPLYNLLRNSELFTPALYAYQRLSGKLKFQTTDKLSSLWSSCSDYDFIVKENQDLQLNLLPLPKIRPWKCSVNSDFTIEDLTDSETGLLMVGSDGVENRYKILKLAEEISGWILGDGINKKNAENKAGISIIQKI